MSAADVFGLVSPCSSLPRLRALPRGEVLGERAGHLRRSSSTRSCWSRSATRSGSGWRGSTRARARRTLLAGSSAASSASSARDAAGSRTGRATARPCSSSASSSGVLYAIQRLQGHLFLNPDHLKGVPAHIVAEHRGELHHEHELAVLRRRVDDVVPDPDGRARGAELRLGRRRDRRCSQPSSVASRAARRRRSGTSGVDLYRALVYILLPLAIVVARDPDLAGRAADVRRPRDGDDTAGRARRRSRAARSPRRSRSSSSARTAAASTTRTRPSRSRTRPALRNFIEMLAILLIPAAQVFMFGQMVLRAPPRLVVFAAMFIVFAVGVGVNCRRAARLGGAAHLGRQHHAAATARRAAT